MQDTVEGHCLCGSIHYRLANEPLRSHLCFCTDCQKVTGGDRNHVAPISVNDFELLSGELSSYESTAASGRIIERAFCENCGCPIYAAVRALGGMGINVPCLDQAENYPPMAAVFVSHAKPWATLPAGIPHYSLMPDD